VYRVAVQLYYICPTEGDAIATDAVLQVRISSKVKNEAEMVFEKLGLSLADAIRVFAIQAIEAQGFPFDINLPKFLSKKMLGKNQQKKILKS